MIKQLLKLKRGLIEVLSQSSNGIFSTNNCKMQLSAFLHALMKKHKTPCVSYVLIDNYTIVSADSASIQSEIIISEKSLFQACSLSKSLTAYAALNLIEKMKIGLDDSINDHLKTWKIPHSTYGDNVSTRQCLNMTSGLCYAEINASFPGYPQGGAIPTLIDILKGQPPANNRPIKLGYEPGSNYFYSGAGYMVLQQLIQDLTSLEYIKYIETVILHPLQMHSSTFQCPLSSELKTLAMPGFNASGEINKDGWDNIPTSASGGLWSTPSDLAKFILALTKAYLGIENSVLSKLVATAMLTPQDHSNYGLGLVLNGKDKDLNFRKNGHNNGYHNELIMFPYTGQGIVIMTNSANGIGLIQEFIDHVSARFKWPKFSSDFNELVPTPVCFK